MKKLYRKGKVHPSPPAPISDHLALLPATILTLTAALSPEDKQVLAYLISCSAASTNHKPTQKRSASAGGTAGDHHPTFNCDCFRCYKSYWVRWDTSPNRQLIDEIIDAYEDGLFQEEKKNNNRSKGAKTKRVERKSKTRVAQELNDDGPSEGEGESGELESQEPSCSGGEVGGFGGEGEVGLEKGSVGGLVSFIRERFWGVWGK